MTICIVSQRLFSRTIPAHLTQNPRLAGPLDGTLPQIPNRTDEIRKLADAILRYLAWQQRQEELREERRRKPQRKHTDD